MKQLFTLVLIALTFAASAQKTDFRSKNPRYEVDTIPMVFDLIDEVDTGLFMPVIRHLSSYTTRLCTSSQAFEAQDWIQDQFEALELSVEIQDFPFWNGNSSDNVIAVLPGKVTPDEYVLVGGHYDSFAFSGTAPGADDNASGISGVLETARILSQYDFERSLVFCAFSAEEMGLIGSEYYASEAAQEGMDILGYFNFDMIGYLHPGDEIHTDMLAPASAFELESFYTQVAAIYMPDFGVEEAEPISGDSDHTSFNNHGYMGIFPFEDTPNYSPYIHTSQDIVGLSVNSPEMAKNFIQATLASLASLAVPYDSITGVRPAPEPSCPVRIFPNPAHDIVTVSNGSGQAMEVRISGTTGQTILRTEVKGTATLDISSLKPGIYFLICEGDDLHETVKLIKP